MATDIHISIGDVLNELRAEFSDVTISKIRFLESQGLIDPERTPSGYRKFSPTDVKKLRWILRQQKDHFLPLKVIKERLAELEASDSSFILSSKQPPSGAQKVRKSARKRATPRTPPAFVIPEGELDPLPVGEMTGVSLTRAELAAAAGIDEAGLAALEEFGLVTPAFRSRDRVLFDEDALGVVQVAAGFLARGIEARHLRMYRGFAEREAALFAQVILAFRRQRNPEADARGTEELGELADLGRRLRSAFLRQAMRQVIRDHG